jgi:hypothetical protein
VAVAGRQWHQSVEGSSAVRMVVLLSCGCGCGGGGVAVKMGGGVNGPDLHFKAWASGGRIGGFCLVTADISIRGKFE